MAKKTSDAQLRACAKYDKENTRKIVLKLNKTTDADVLAALACQVNMQGYIKRLIRDDTERRRKDDLRQQSDE